MIHTDEDDEFDRIEREAAMKGQPYHWEADAIKAAVLIEREACAEICNRIATEDGWEGGYAYRCVEAIRARGYANDTSAERVDITEEHKHDTPPQRTWQGLTDEDMGFLFPHGKSAWVQEIVKIIEAKLKEKNT